MLIINKIERNSDEVPFENKPKIMGEGRNNENIWGKNFPGWVKNKHKDSEARVVQNTTEDNVAGIMIKEIRW